MTTTAKHKVSLNNTTRENESTHKFREVLDKMRIDFYHSALTVENAKIYYFQNLCLHIGNLKKDGTIDIYYWTDSTQIEGAEKLREYCQKENLAFRRVTTKENRKTLEKLLNLLNEAEIVQEEE